MIAISLWQPWASALFAPFKHGVSPLAIRQAIKLHETRHWPMPRHYINQWVAIHAAKRDTGDEREFWQDVVMDPDCRERYGHAFAAIGIQNYRDLPRGCIVGTVRFGPSKRTEEFPEGQWPESDWGNYSEGRFAWPVIETQHFPTPIPCVGRQGFFNVELALPVPAMKAV